MGGDGQDQGLAQVTPHDSTAYMHRDALGSVTALSLPTGALVGATTYGAFGTVESQTGAVGRYGYTSREADATGLLYYRARYLQPSVGRFLSSDPYAVTQTTPENLHRYSYVNNQPTIHVDPTGLFTLRMTGLVFLVTAAIQMVNFFRFLAPEMKATAEMIVQGRSDFDVLRSVIFFMFFEGMILGAAVVYAQIGWHLLSKPAVSWSRLGMPLMRAVHQVKNFMNIMRGLGSNQFWSFAITAGCMTVFAPALASVSISGTEVGYSLGLCAMTVTGVMKVLSL